MVKHCFFPAIVDNLISRSEFDTSHPLYPLGDPDGGLSPRASEEFEENFKSEHLSMLCIDRIKGVFWDLIPGVVND